VILKRKPAEAAAPETAPTPEASTVWLRRLVAQAADETNDAINQTEQAAAVVKKSA
jgi:hypothetical protein